ncbi:MAG: hypothetical protein KDC98_07990 [Planctomycetes bacterium]|nr:hypothetical protein [Planctomycetota bacterium]
MTRDLLLLRRLAPVALGLVVACAAPRQAVEIAFDSEAELARWEFTDAAAFRWAREESDGRGCLELHAASSYQPPHRSPLALAILRDVECGDFTLKVRARQTGREYGHRDLVFVFAWRDPAHFLYAHLASQADANAHQVMLVDGAPRRPVTTARTTGIDWGDGWHDIELRRRGVEVEVLFDGVQALRAEVPTWPGRIGLGSFDDTGRFADLSIWLP